MDIGKICVLLKTSPVILEFEKFHNPKTHSALCPTKLASIVNTFLCLVICDPPQLIPRLRTPTPCDARPRLPRPELRNCARMRSTNKYRTRKGRSCASTGARRSRVSTGACPACPRWAAGATGLPPRALQTPQACFSRREHSRRRAVSSAPAPHALHACTVNLSVLLELVVLCHPLSFFQKE